MNKHLKHFLLILTIFAFSIALRLFVFEIYAIPSSSMEHTLIPGDKVLVNKLLIGPRMPRSPFEIPWVNLVFMLNKDAREKIDEKWWPYRRWKGFSKIKHNDIIVFESLVKEDIIFIKRCIALPGDGFRLFQIVSCCFMLFQIVSGCSRNGYQAVVDVQDGFMFPHKSIPAYRSSGQCNGRQEPINPYS